MQIDGKITNIVSDGGYDGAHGHVFTYQLSIDNGQVDANGEPIIVTGQIGSKKQQYPKNVGDDISVNSTTNAHGTSFKAVFNQQQGGGGGGGYQQQPQQQQQQAPAGQPAPDWDKIARGKVTHGVVCGGIASGQLKCESADDVEMWTNLIMDSSK